VTGTAADPLGLLLRDRQTAREREDPCANLCTLANVDGDGLPQARTLVLREIERRLAVFVNATSPKFPFLDDATVSVVVWLPSISIQYRLACATTLVEPAVVAQSWQLRPDPPPRVRPSRVGKRCWSGWPVRLCRSRWWHRTPPGVSIWSRS
jgi:pyridoxine/pyridoxamine 5'-phosphate oxidase